MNGELVPSFDRLPGPQDKRCKEVVEAGPEVVNHLTGEHCKTVWHGDKETSTEDVVLKLVVKFSGDHIRLWITADESGDVRVEVLDAFIGALNFRSTTAQ